MKTRHNYRDAVEPELVTLAKQLGGAMFMTGPLDWWLWHPRRAGWLPVEIKDPTREGLKHEYTPLQQRFLTFCLDHHAPKLIWRTRADVLRDLGGRITA